MSDLPFDLSRLKGHIGDRISRTDVVDPRPLAQLALALNRDEPPPRQGDPLLPGRHWLYFTSNLKSSDLKKDGLPRATPPIPPVPLPRRMWGGARTEYIRPLRVGSVINRETSVKDIYEKRGATGPLVFVVLQHEIRDEAGIAIVEEHDYFFRDPGQSSTKREALKPAFGDAHWSATFTADIGMLFRYSAILFNAHRIHFDRGYAQEVEKYPGAVVHGPLTATMLIDQCLKEVARPIRRFEYRGVVPLFDGENALLAGRLDGDVARAWATNAQGNLAMSAKVHFQ